MQSERRHSVHMDPPTATSATHLLGGGGRRGEEEEEEEGGARRAGRRSRLEIGHRAQRSVVSNELSG